MSRQKARAAQRQAVRAQRDSQRRLEWNSQQLWDEQGQEFEPVPHPSNLAVAHVVNDEPLPADVEDIPIYLMDRRLRVCAPGTPEHARALDKRRANDWFFMKWRSLDGRRLLLLVGDREDCE